MSQNIEEIKDYAHKNSVPIMKDGGMDFICRYIKEHNVKDILEIGTAIGYSAIMFAKLDPEIHVTTIEIDIDRHIKARQNIRDCGLEDRIEARNEDALYADIDKSFDLIFIDGPKAQYINFFNRYSKNLRENGVIVSDNLLFHGMVEDISLTHNYSTVKLVQKIKRYIDFLKANEEFNTEFFRVGDGVSISRRKKNVRSYRVSVYGNQAFESPLVAVVIDEDKKLDEAEQKFIASRNGSLETAFVSGEGDSPCIKVLDQGGMEVPAVKSMIASFYICNMDKKSEKLIFKSSRGDISLAQVENGIELKLTEEDYDGLDEILKAPLLTKRIEGSRIYISGKCRIFSEDTIRI